MTQPPNVITLDMVGPAIELTPEAAHEYFRASMRVVPILQKCVINPMEATLKMLPGFDVDNPPKPSPHVFRHTLDDVLFNVTTTATTKTPSYQEVYDDLRSYLKHLHEEKEAGKAVPCVRTIDGNLYVSLDDVMAHIREYKARVLESTISQSLEYKAPGQLEAERLDRLVVPVQNYGLLMPGSGTMYVRAVNFVEEAKGRAIKPFEAKLKEATGYSKANIPRETVPSYIQVGDHLFYMQNIPSRNPDYNGIVNALVYETETGKVTKKTGELVLARDGVPDPRLESYAPRVRDGETYVSLPGIRQRIETLTLALTKHELRQPITPFPVV